MSAPKHSPEPWTVMSHATISSGTDDILCVFGETHDDPTPQDWENLGRATVCVNACAGIPTEALEAGAVRELVEALKSTARYPAHRNWDNLPCWCDGDEHHVPHCLEARAALAKVRP